MIMITTSGGITGQAVIACWQAINFGKPNYFLATATTGSKAGSKFREVKGVTYRYCSSSVSCKWVVSYFGVFHL